MASNRARKRKRSTSTIDGTVSTTTYDDSGHEDAHNLHQTAPSHLPPMQDFANFNVQDHARAHVGNVYYNISNLNTEGRDEAARRRFMEVLAFKQMDIRRAAIDPAYGKTCQWIFEDEGFLRWRTSIHQGPNSDFYWIKGKPGSGKSTIMKAVFEHLQDHMTDCTIISFFFNARGDQLERSSYGCYRSLLHQMLERMPKLHTSLRTPSIPIHGPNVEFAIVRDKLREAVLHLQQDSMVLIIDALDECYLQEVRDMIRFLDSLAASARLRSIRLKICLASRHYPNITIRSCESIVIESQQAHTEDIHEYVRENLYVQNEQQRQELVDKIIKKSKGIFMWVILVTRRLNEQLDRGTTFKKLLDDVYTLPSDLNTLIQSIITDGASDACLLPILLWTLVAGRPLPGLLGLSGFCFAILFSAGKLKSLHRRECAVDLDNIGAMERFVLHSSKGLVEIIQHGSRQFIHESIRQHILDGGLLKLHPSLGCNVEAASHAMVAEWCLDYVRHDLAAYSGFPAIPSSGTVYWDIEKANEEDRLAHAFPLIAYVLAATLAHIDVAFSGGSYDLNRLRGFPRMEWIKLANMFRQFGWYLEPTASLVFLCLEGIRGSEHSGIIRQMLEYRLIQQTITETDDAEEIDPHLCTLLFGTSLDDFCGGRAGTPLISAAQQGRTEFVKLLLDAGADPNKTDPHLEPDKQVTQAELEIDLDKIARISCPWGYGTPLAAAVSQSDMMMPLVEILLSRGAQINVCSGRRGGALGTALYHGCWKIFNLLMREGADVNLKDQQGLNIALRQAIDNPRRRQCAPSVRGLRDLPIAMLLSRGVEIDPATVNILLHMAARAGRPRAVQLLVNAGADPRCRDVKGRTALHTLAEAPQSELTTFDHVLTVDSLVALDVDVNACGGEYDTALIAASALAKPDVVRCLLNHGADINYKSDKHGNALDAAIYHAGDLPSNYRQGSHTQVVESLSNAGLKRSAIISK